MLLIALSSQVQNSLLLRIRKSEERKGFFRNVSHGGVGGSLHSKYLILIVRSNCYGQKNGEIKPKLSQEGGGGSDCILIKDSRRQNYFF